MTRINHDRPWSSRRTSEIACATNLIIVPLFSTGRLGPTRVTLPAGSGGIR